MEFKTIMTLVDMVADVDTIEWEDVNVDGCVITIQGTDYIVLDDEEIRDRINQHILDTASYFNTGFLSLMTELPEEVFVALVDKNEAVYALIEKTCGLDAFIDECLAVDGAGHFLNNYDGEEYDLGNGLSAFNY